MLHTPVVGHVQTYMSQRANPPVEGQLSSCCGLLVFNTHAGRLQKSEILHCCGLDS